MTSETNHQTPPPYRLRPRGATFEGFPPLSLPHLIISGGITVCPRNNWARRVLRRGFV